MRIEAPYPDFNGLNLCWETLEGLAKHNGPVTQPSWALAEADAQFPLDLSIWPSLEAQVAAVADDIAYDNHDIDDGIRAGLLSLDDVLEVPLVAESWKNVRDHWPALPPERLTGELIREQIGRMVNDVITESRRRIAIARPEDTDEVRQMEQALVDFSRGMSDEERALKRFMYTRLYRHPRQIDISERANLVISNLAEAYLADPELMPEHWRLSLPEEEPLRTRHIGDFIAGMTDRYALARYREIIGPIEMPDAF
jgi:dGTPase